MLTNKSRRLFPAVNVVREGGNIRRLPFLWSDACKWSDLCHLSRAPFLSVIYRILYLILRALSTPSIALILAITSSVTTASTSIKAYA